MSTILSPGTPITEEAGWSGYTLRAIMPALTGNGLGQVRVTIVSPVSSVHHFQCNNWAIGKWAGGANGDTTATPVELLQVGGAHGFDIFGNDVVSTTLVSEWVTFSCSIGDQPVIVFDNVNTGSPYNMLLTGVSGADSYYKAASASYNAATVAGQTHNATGTLYGVSLIESQAGGGGTSIPKSRSSTPALPWAYFSERLLEPVRDIIWKRPGLLIPERG